MAKCYHEVEHANPMIYRLTEYRTTLSPPRASRAELITRMVLSQPEASGAVQKPGGKPRKTTSTSSTVELVDVVFLGFCKAFAWFLLPPAGKAPAAG